MNKKIIVSIMVVVSLSILGSNVVSNLKVSEGNSLANTNLVTPYAEHPVEWLD